MPNPWLKFYPQDWRGDQGLRMVSLAARGLWIEMLCIMHTASPYGHLLIGGKPVEGGALSRLAGTNVDEVEASLAELESAGVFSRSRRGVIYSRRMVHDKNRAEKGKKAANKRWSQNTDNNEEKAEPNGSGNGSPNTQKPEARGSDTVVSGVPPSLSEQLYGGCLAYVVSVGSSDKNARSLIGRWRKRFGDAETVTRLSHCQANSISDPVAYMEKSAPSPASVADGHRAYMAKRYGGATA